MTKLPRHTAISSPRWRRWRNAQGRKWCLFNFGTGPIRGFAVTLLIGIVATVYTAYFVGKLFFEFYMNKVEGQDLSI